MVHIHNFKKMNRPKQATLFQSWGSRSQANADRVGNQGRASTSNDHGDLIDLCDEDDEEDQLLARALEESLAHYQNTESKIHSNQRLAGKNAASATPSKAHEQEDVGNISFGIDDNNVLDCGAANDADRHCLSQWKKSDLPVDDLPGFDSSAGHLWIYPTNYPVREYQFNIVKQALVKNTLVTLPTGLGKTFIASVVMYNFYRWYPEGKVVFMAPTKPLVAQQIEACYNIMGIPRDDTAEMTGTMNPTDRQKAWRDRRVFFLTPQVLTNDLSRGTCTAEDVKCLVIDEAHKALGNHAYCQVVRELVKYTRQFRVLALSATPGSDMKAVQQVISNLLICHIELRGEESADIKPYTHERTVDKIVVPLGDELNDLKKKYIQVLSVVVRRLTQQRVLYNREPTSLSKFLILKAREAFRQNPPENLPRSQYGVVEGDFALAMSLYHGYELLQLHGLRSLYNFLQGVVSGDKAYGRTRTELMRNADFCTIMDILRDKFQPSIAGPDQKGTSSKPKGSFAVGHPKMVKLEQVVVDHFNKCQAEGHATRVMIFSQYRDSVQEITQMLQQHEPLVKVMSFIGQSSAGKATKGFTQKEQLKVMQAFRTGGYNTLVSTCVGEEGLDIGDVDLIVCFDAHKSPIRLVQRMGRTGRKRQGRIVMLVTEGKEEQIYNHSQYTKRSIHRSILNGAKSLIFYPSNPRMIPVNLTPACHRMHITVQQHQDKGKGAGKGRKSQGKISSLFSKAKSGAGRRPAKEEAGISLEEFAELKSSGAAVTTQYLPAPKMVTLQSHDEEDCDKVGLEGELNFSDWLPWQNSLQQTSQFGHSQRSRHLVELLEFTDLQQVLPPEEDNYGQEMRIYLNMDDVISDSSRPVSGDITQFCVPADKCRAVTHTGDEGTVEPQSKKGKKTSRAKLPGKRKRTPFPVLEIEEDSDSDALPDVDFSKPSIIKGQTSSPSITSRVESRPAMKATSPSHRKEKRRKKSKPDRSSLLSMVVSSTENDDFDDFEPCGGTSRSFETGAEAESEISKPVQDASHSRVNPSVDSPQEICDDQERESEYVADVPMDTIDSFDLEKHKSEGEEMSADSKTNEVFRVPTPPPLENVTAILTRITKPEDLQAVDLHSLLKNCAFSQSRSIRGSQPHMSEVLVVPTDAYTGREVQIDDVAPECREDVQVRETADDRPADGDMSLHLDDSFSDSLDEVDFDLISERLLQGYQASNKPSSSDSHAPNKTNRASKVKEPCVENGHKSQRMQLSQAEPKSKKPLFKECGDSSVQVLQPVDSNKTDSASSTKNGIPKRQKTSFVYRMDESSTVSNSLKESEVHAWESQRKVKPVERCEENAVMPPEAVMVESGGNEPSNITTTNTTSMSGWTTGKQMLQLAASTAVPDPQENTHTLEFSMSDSLLHRHFLDEEDDGDFADALHMPDSTGKQTSPTSTSTGSKSLTSSRPQKLAQQSEKQFEEENLSRLGMLDTPALFSPEPVKERSPHSRPQKLFLHSDKTERLTEGPSLLHAVDAPDLFSPEAVKKKNPPQSKPRKLILKTDKSLTEGPSLLDMVDTPALFSPEVKERSPSGPVWSPMPGTERSAKSDSILTFTQALACVHSSSHSESSHADSKESHSDSRQSHSDSRENCTERKISKVDTPTDTRKVSNIESVNSTVNVGISARSSIPALNAGSENTVNTVGEGLLELEDSPNFDLGFDFDEDIIPPSPEAEPSVSQPGLRSQLSFKTAVSVPVVEAPTATKSLLDHVPEALDFEDDDILLAAHDENLEEHHSPCFTSSFQCRNNQTADVGKSKVSTPKRKEFPEEHFTSELLEFESHTSESRHSVCGRGATTTAPVSSQGFTCHKQTDNVDDDEDSLSVLTQNKISYKSDAPVAYNMDTERNTSGACTDIATSKPVKKPQLSLAAIGTEPEGKSANSGDDLGTFSPHFVLLHDLDDEFDDDFGEMDVLKTPAQKKSPPSVYCSTPLSNKKPARFTFQATAGDTPTAPRRAHVSHTALAEDDGSDFEESIIRRRNVKLKGRQLHSSESEDDRSPGAKVKFKVPDKQAKRKKETATFNKKKKRKGGCAFLDNEAELSDDVDVSSDEAEDNLDQMEGSFIDNATQFTQASQTDIQALYLKSVRSPVSHGHAQGARFRLQYNHAARMDVFSQPPRPDEEESQYQEDSFCVGSEEEDEDEEEESYETGSEDDDDDFDLTALERQKPSTSKRKKKKQAVKQVQGRKRVRQITDSSSDDDEDLHRLPPSQITPAPKRPSAVRALLSSSDDLDTSVPEKSPAKSEQVASVAGRSEYNRQEDGSSQGFRCALPEEGRSASDLSKATALSRMKSSEYVRRGEPKSILGLAEEGKALNSAVNLGHTAPSREVRSDQRGGLCQSQRRIQAVTPSSSTAVVFPSSSSFLPAATKGPPHSASRQNLASSRTTDSFATSTSSSVPSLSVPYISPGSVSKTTAAGSSGSINTRPSSYQLTNAGDVRNDAVDSSRSSLQVGAGTDHKPSDSVKFTSIASRERGKVVILVDSREISGAQDIVSALRLQHNAYVCARQLTACDYILSNRMAVERLTWSGFSTSTNRNKLCERVQQMQALYDRCVIIVEKDRVKPGEEKSARPQQHSKYVDSIIAQLSHTSVRVFFTENQGETAKLLAGLSNSESRKSMAISAPVNLNQEKEQVVKFYLSVPMLNITHALNLCLNFHSVNDFLQSPVTEIQKKGHMSFSRAQEVYNFIRHRFSAALMSSS